MTSRHHKALLSNTVLIVLSFLWLAFSNIAIADICDISSGSGIGGTGSPMHGSGIGGTGDVARDSGSGIGGTGKPRQKQIRTNNNSIVFNGSGIGGTGTPIPQTGVVIGTITGFGSICVNGIEIHYTADTPLQRDDQFVKTDNSFAIGQVVAVSVSGSGNEVTAKEMHILHTAIGPVSSINVANNEIEMLGQSIQLPVNSDRINANSGIQIGNYIEVSGLRNHQGNIVASRIDEISPSPTVSIRGPVSEISATTFKIQGLTVNSAPPQGISLGQEVQVTGVFNGDELTPNNISLAKENELTTNVGGLVSIEGYINKTANTLEISGRVIDVPSSLQDNTAKIADHQRVIVTGQLGENNVIILDHLLVDMPNIDNDDIYEPQELENEDSHDQNKHQEDDNQQDDIEKVEHEDKSPETHEFEAPEQGEHEYETPEAPEYEAPEDPEYEAPEAPEYEAPEAPEYEAPEAPEYEAPEVPEYEAPEVPEYEAPEVPEYEAPEVPEYEAPEVPEYEGHED